jgi:hypothetical protein
MSATMMLRVMRVPTTLLMMMTKTRHNGNLRYVFVDAIIRIVTQCCMQHAKKGKNTHTRLWDQVVVKRNNKKGKRGAVAIDR